MHSLRSQIEHFEGEHGRSLSLRRAYNKLLGGAGESKSGAGESKSAGESKTEFTCVRSLTIQHPVHLLCVLADGSQLFSGSGRTIQKWDVATNTVQTLHGQHEGSVFSVCVSADGSRLFSGSGDLTIKVWDVATGACVQTLEGHTDWVRSVCVSVDGSRLFSGSDDKTIKVWDVATGVCVRTLRGHRYAVFSVCVSVDGSRLFSGSWDKTIRVWDVATGVCVQTLRGHTRDLKSVCVSADGSRLFSGSADETIKFWSPLPKQWETLKSEISSFMESGVDSSVSNIPFDLKQAFRQVTLNHFREGLLNLKAEADAIGFVLSEYRKFYKYCNLRTNLGAGASARKKKEERIKTRKGMLTTH